jgi:DNA-binding NarL/FixJ family response regulator
MSAPPQSPIRVLLIDDHALVRAGIRALLEEMPNVAVVGQADCGREGVRLFAEKRPDLVIIDISMRELNGIDAAIEMLELDRSARVLVLTMYSSEDFVRRALRIGASGYLVKDAAPHELQMAIEAVMRGEIFVSSRVSRHLVTALADVSEDASSLDGLSPRQRQILQLVAEGKRTKEIAASLGVSVKTVETHRAAIMDRLGIHDLAGLVLYAVQKGLVDVGTSG